MAGVTFATSQGHTVCNDCSPGPTSCKQHKVWWNLSISILNVSVNLTQIAYMGSTWGWQDAGRHHVGPRNLAIKVNVSMNVTGVTHSCCDYFIYNIYQLIIYLIILISNSVWIPVKLEGIFLLYVNIHQNLTCNGRIFLEKYLKKIFFC